jgi:predicted DNA-binding protein (MmcQ/YjbR family)
VALAGEQLQQPARDTAASLTLVTAGHPFTPHLEVWKVHDKVFLIVTDDDPDRQIVMVKVDPASRGCAPSRLRHDHGRALPRQAAPCRT